MKSSEVLKVVIPTYNRAGRIELLLEKIKSAAEQSQIKIVVVDDFSSKEEQDKLKSISLIMKDIDFIFLPENLGGGNARNVGAFTGPARWVWFIDDDDLVTSEVIIGVSEAVRKNKDQNLFFLNGVFHSKESKRVVNPNGGNVFKQFARYGNEINTSCVIFNFELFNKINGWDAKLVAGQDTDILLRAVEITDAYVLSDFSVDIIAHDGERITTNPKKQMIGKAQFICKNYSRLHPLRLSRYILTLIFLTPYLKFLIKK